MLKKNKCRPQCRCIALRPGLNSWMFNILSVQTLWPVLTRFLVFWACLDWFGAFVKTFKHQQNKTIVYISDFQESSARKTQFTANAVHLQGEKECECWECLCVGRALVRVTSRSFTAAALSAATATATDDQTFRPQNFSGARLFRFLNKGLFSTLSP